MNIADAARKRTALREALEGDERDPFDLGDVIRWTAGEKYIVVAIRTPVGWYTSATERAEFYHPGISGVLNYTDLLEILKSADVSDVQIASCWSTVL